MMKHALVPAVLSLAVLGLVPGCDGLVPWTPDKPVITEGPDTGLVDLMYSFKTTCNGGAGKQVSYRFDWGDGDTSDWSAAVVGSAEYEETKFWEQAGTYQVRSQARGDEVSEWSEPHQVVIADSGPQYPFQVVGTIAVEGGPWDVAIADPDHEDYLYVTARAGNRVVVVRRDDGGVVAEVEVAGEPRGIAANPVRGEVLVACGQGQVVGIRTADNQEFIRFAAGAMPYDLDFTPDGSFLYITDPVQENVHVFETSQYQPVTEVRVGHMPHGVVVEPGGSCAYVANNASDSVTVLSIQDHSVVKTVRTGPGTDWLAVDPGGERVYVSLAIDNEVAVIRTADHTVEGTAVVGGSPQGIGVLPSGAYYYVGNHLDNTVSVVRAADNQVVRTIEVGHGPTAVRVSPDGRYVYVCNSIANSVTVLGF